MRCIGGVDWLKKEKEYVVGDCSGGWYIFFLQAEEAIRGLVRSVGLGVVLRGRMGPAPIFYLHHDHLK